MACTGRTKVREAAQSVVQRNSGVGFYVGQDRSVVLICRSLGTHLFGSHQISVQFLYLNHAGFPYQLWPTTATFEPWLLNMTVSTWCN